MHVIGFNFTFKDGSDLGYIMDVLIESYHLPIYMFCLSRFRFMITLITAVAVATAAFVDITSPNFEYRLMTDTQGDTLELPTPGEPASEPEPAIYLAEDTFNPFLPYQQDRAASICFFAAIKRLRISRWIEHGRKALLRNLTGDLSWANGKVVTVKSAEKSSEMMIATIEEPEGISISNLRSFHLKLLFY